MRQHFIRISAIAAIVLAPSVVSSHNLVNAEASAPDYSIELPECTSGANGFNNKPCYQPNPAPATDAGQAHLDKCSVSLTNWCYSLKVDGADAPSTLGANVAVGAYKTHDSTVSGAGYEATATLWKIPDGHSANENYWGWGKRPFDQGGNGGLYDLTGVVSPTSVITMVIKYKTKSMPQYSVLLANEGSMDFSMNGQDLTLTLTGKPSRTSLEDASTTINYDTEHNDDTTLPWTNRCGIPNMQIVVCNINQAVEDPLIFHARSKTFINGSASEVPAPIWVNTNAMYFHFPSVVKDSVTGKRYIQFKTAAPHLRADGSVNTANAATFIPNGVLAQWNITKDDATLKRLLSSKIVKVNSTVEAATSYTITDLGVKVYFPEITYSAPMLQVGESGTTTESVVVPSISTKSLGKGKSKSLTSLIALKGKGKATWKASGGCTVKAGKLVAPKKAATCKLTLSQAKYGKTAARKVTINVKVS